MARLPSSLLLVLACHAPAQAPTPPAPTPTPAIERSRTGTVEGVVVDVLGDPVPAAAVEARVAGRRVGRTATDGSGIYQLQRLPPDLTELHFSAPGKAAMTLPWRGPTSPRVRNVVLEDGCRLRGKVADGNGDPLAGAAVVVVAGGEAQETRTAADGTFAFAAVAMRRAVLRAWTGAGFGERELRLTGDADTTIAVTQRGGPRLVRVDGLPAEAIADAAMHVFSPDLALMPNRGRFALRADASTEVLVKGMAIYQPSIPGFGTTPECIAATESAATITFRAEARPASSKVPLFGRLRTPDNRALPGHRMVVRDRSGRDLATTVVDAAGRFRVEVPKGYDNFFRLGVELRSVHLVGDQLELLDGFSWLPGAVGAGEAIELVAEPTGTLDGALRTADGQQFLFAEVVAADVEHPVRAASRTNTDRTGHLHLNLPVGRYELLAMTLDGRVATATATVAAGATDAIRWEVVPTGDLRGRVVAAGGHPVPGVELLVASTDLQHSAGSASRRQSCRVLTGRDGTFHCRGLPAGDWTVVSLAGDVVEDAVTITAGKELSLVVNSR